MPQLLSIITTTYNNISAFKTTYASLSSCFAKSSFAFDYVIVDSSNTSCIREFVNINCYPNLLCDIKYIHVEPSGPYDAMNAGISACVTKYVWILNAGDAILSIPEDFNLILAKLSIPINGCVTKTLPPSQAYGTSNYSSFYNFRLHELHPACVIPLAIYRQLGCYDSNFKVAADLHFLLRAARHHSFYFIPALSVYYPSGGISSRHKESLLTILKIIVSSRHLLVTPFFVPRYLYYLIFCS
jgi:glycosyltransferase involved in cell wall biosynthesis